MKEDSNHSEWAVEVSREAGNSPMGHFFPGEKRLLKNMDKVLTFQSKAAAEIVARIHSRQPCGFTRKTYRAVPYRGD